MSAVERRFSISPLICVSVCPIEIESFKFLALAVYYYNISSIFKIEGERLLYSARILGHAWYITLARVQCDKSADFPSNSSSVVKILRNLLIKN